LAGIARREAAKARAAREARQLEELLLIVMLAEEA
jgi:hypothetical protein